MVSPRFGEQKTCLGNSQTACEFPKLLVIFIIALLTVAVLSISLVIQEFLATMIAHIFSTIAFIFFCTEPPNIFDATILIVNLFFAPFFNHFYSRTLLLKVKKIRPQTGLFFTSILSTQLSHFHSVNSTL